MLSESGFDVWSEEYDEYVKKCSNEYPFDGYYAVLDYVYCKVENKKSRILDVGIGTGFLVNRLYKGGAIIYGMDFSQKMIQISGEKMPGATLLEWDFNYGLPPEIQTEKFDYIISTYAIHHLSDDKKLEFIEKLSDSLNKDGKIVIADISFPTGEKLNECKGRNPDKWDHDEFYIAADKFIDRLKLPGFKVLYSQISSCVGVLELSPV